MFRPCLLPFPTDGVRRRLRRQLELPDIDQRPAASRVSTAVDQLPLQYVPVRKDYPQQVVGLGSL